MARPSSEHLTQLKLELLRILWQQAPLSVQQVRELLEQQPAVQACMNAETSAL